MGMRKKEGMEAVWKGAIKGERDTRSAGAEWSGWRGRARGRRDRVERRRRGREG